jgi:hypothetical protein
MARKPPTAAPPIKPPAIQHRSGTGRFKSPPAHKSAAEQKRHQRTQQTGKGPPDNACDPGNDDPENMGGARDPNMQDGAFGDDDSEC